MVLPPSDRKLIIAAIFGVTVVLLYSLLSPYLSLAYLDSQREAFNALYAQHPVTVPLGFSVLSVLLIGMALPVTGVLALLGGALFGFYLGWALTAVTGTLGALIVFLWSRYLFHDWLQRHFAMQFSKLNRGIKAEGLYYLFSIRLTAVFPFFLVNVLCGLTTLGIRSYILATLLGQTIVVAFFVYAGATLASFESPGDILNAWTVSLLFIAGLLPYTIHRLLSEARIRAGVSNSG